jgi:YgiT-type zinc finger domain-containing protein
MNPEEQPICDVCGKGNARIRRITRAYGKEDDLLLIENVPVVNCLDCGESHLTAETLHQINQIKRERQRFVVERFVEVARLG